MKAIGLESLAGNDRSGLRDPSYPPAVGFTDTFEPQAGTLTRNLI